MTNDKLISDHVNTPTPFLTHSLQKAIEATYPDQHVIETAAWNFDFEAYAEAELCKLSVEPDALNYEVLNFRKSAYRTYNSAEFTIEWQDKSFNVIRVSYVTDCGPQAKHWIVGENPKSCDSFFEAVCTWCDELRGVILTFSNGYWQRSRQLYKAIQSASLDSLIMPSGMKAEILSDFTRFLASEENYAKYRAPWKRGVLFTGPPGNGKTHFIRALVAQLNIPCFYVKSFETRDQLDNTGIQEVYRTLRATSPCILVLEDLDSLITDRNRTYFLNELDGFEHNHGVITVATTNHPEKLDPAILERPSRFDQKWFFGLPESGQRSEYIKSWHQVLPESTRLNKKQLEKLAEATGGFSYAYLKELCLVSALKLVQDKKEKSIFKILKKQCKLLKKQSQQTQNPEPAPVANPVGEMPFEMDPVVAAKARQIWMRQQRATRQV